MKKSRAADALSESFGMWASPEFDEVERRILEARLIDRKTSAERERRIWGRKKTSLEP